VSLQVKQREEAIHCLEHTVEELRSEVQAKGRHIHDMQENLGDLKADLASVREQKNAAEREVCVITTCQAYGYFE
jgi:predicted  nucleic acid-binding Zn-ribbon protein